jgi:hypothetical protein
MYAPLLVALAALVALVAFAPLARTQEPSNTDVRREIADLLSKFVDSANKGDVTTMSELVSSKSGFVAIGNGEIVKGHDELMKNAGVLVGKQGKYTLALGQLDINTIKNGVIVATGPYTVQVSGETASVLGKGGITFVCEKQDKYWRIAHLHRSLAEAEIH